MKKYCKIILGIETSCDETAAAVVANGRIVLSNVISSQVNEHRIYGGVVPEIAARKHVESISYIVSEALTQAGLTINEIDGIAVSNGPGLVGALLVGLSFAKALAFAKNIPLLGVNHIYSHICANYLVHNADTRFFAGFATTGGTDFELNHCYEWEPPFISLVVSGGHTHLIEVSDYDKFRVLGRTRDDAAGEAFDKVGRSLGLPYPGGPEIDQLAKNGDPCSITFPRTILIDDKKIPTLDFSFSGLKSAVLQYLQKNKIRKQSTTDVTTACASDQSAPDVAASFQQAVIDVLVSNTIEACERTGLSKVALAGGVAANKRLRQVMEEECRNRKINLHLPEAIYCTDNAAMVASGGYFQFNNPDGYDLNAYPNIDIGSEFDQKGR